MPRLIMVGLATVCFVVTARADTTLTSYAFSKQYIVSFSRETLEKSPSWKEDDANPPVSAKKAIELATEMKNSLVKDSKEFKWKLQSASLQPVGGGKWYWLVHFDAEFQGFSSGIPNHIRLVVLMDGTVVKPVVKDQR